MVEAQAHGTGSEQGLLMPVAILHHPPLARCDYTTTPPKRFKIALYALQSAYTTHNSLKLTLSVLWDMSIGNITGYLKRKEI